MIDGIKVETIKDHFAASILMTGILMDTSGPSTLTHTDNTWCLYIVNELYNEVEQILTLLLLTKTKKQKQKNWHLNKD